MNRMLVHGLRALCIGSLLAGAAAVWAQEDDEGEAPAVPVQPHPAEVMPLAPNSLLLGIANTGKHLVAVGDRGNIIASNDGTHWAQVEVPVRATLTSVAFVDADHGWAAGHDAAILATADGGKTWTLQNFEPDLEKPVLDLLFTDAQNGMAVGAYGLFKATHDGGTTWEDVDAPAIGEDELHFNKIIQLHNGSYFIVGEAGMMGVSADGIGWERLTSPYEGSLYGAAPRGDAGAVVYGLRGNAYVTDDVRAGNWTQIDMGTVASFFGGTTMPSGEVVMVGLAGEYAVLGPDGQVRRGKIEAMAGVTGSGTLAGAVPWKDGVLAVGELGVSYMSR